MCAFIFEDLPHSPIEGKTHKMGIPKPMCNLCFYDPMW
jgi:hypothetical protein